MQAGHGASHAASGSEGSKVSATGPSPSVLIRDFDAGDFKRVHEINEAAVPAVNSLTRDELERLSDMAALTLVAERAGRVDGFALYLTEGLDYDSVNYTWISKRFERFAYVDRVAVSDEARGSGLGRAIYEAAFEHLGRLREKLICEVNLAPANPVSVAFHRALGFEEIGQRWLADRSKGVVYLARSL